MVSQAGHDKSVDWWAIGVLIYEMLIGVTPFFNKNKNMLLTKIVNSKVVFPDRKKYKIDYSDEIQDLITRLLDKNKDTRIGSTGGAEEIMAHPAFKGISVEELLLGKVKPFFKPETKTLEDMEKYFNIESDKEAM